jgi:hypothetical protein
MRGHGSIFKRDAKASPMNSKTFRCFLVIIYIGRLLTNL